MSSVLSWLRRGAALGAAAAMLTGAIGTPEALAAPRGGHSPGTSTPPTWTVVNSAASAHGGTPSGITMTVTKKLAEGTKVAKAESLPANPLAPADEYLVPVNAKAVAGISDRYEGFRVRPNGWSDVATLTFTFSRPVHNPRLHVAGTGGATKDAEGNREEYWSGLRLVGATPMTRGFSNAAGFPGFVVTKDAVVPRSTAVAKKTTCGVVYMCGTAQVDGTVNSFTVQLRARNVRRGLPAGDPFMWGVFRVTFDEDDSDAPSSYGAASHAVSDLAIGDTVTADNLKTVSQSPRRLAADADDAALPKAVEVNPGLQLTVPVRVARPAVLAGWVDFNRDGRFQPEERASAVAQPGAGTASLRWANARGAKSGPSWLRLRLATDGRDVLRPAGWAATGEVEDHPVTLSARAARISFGSSARRAGKGEAVAFTTTIDNPTSQAFPYRVTAGMRDVLDDARLRGMSQRPASRTRHALTWRGTLQPGETREIRVRVKVKEQDLGDRRMTARWSGDGERRVTVPVRGSGRA